MDEREATCALTCGPTLSPLRVRRLIYLLPARRSTDGATWILARGCLTGLLENKSAAYYLRERQASGHAPRASPRAAGITQFHHF